LVIDFTCTEIPFPDHARDPRATSGQATYLPGHFELWSSGSRLLFAHRACATADAFDLMVPSTRSTPELSSSDRHVHADEDNDHLAALAHELAFRSTVFPCSVSWQNAVGPNILGAPT
jgi:hypothetical protein